MNNDEDSNEAGERSAETGLLSSATLERAAMALDYKMRALAPMFWKAEERRNHELAAALREGAENDSKALAEIQELQRRLDNSSNSGDSAALSPEPNRE